MTHVSKRTIDYYTNIGLIEAERTSTNYRYYSAETIKKLQTIKQLKNENMSLSEIKSYLKQLNCKNKDVTDLNQKLQCLENDLSEIIEFIQKNKLDKEELVTKHISHERITLLQSLLILLL